VSFLISAALVARITARELQSETALTRGHWADLADGFRTVAHSRALLAVLVGWGIASLGIGGANVAEIFLAKDVFNSGDVGYGLLYAAIGTGLVVGSFWSTRLLERIGTPRAYGLALLLMAGGFMGAGLSPNVWVAAVFCVVAGLGDGAAIVCNALLVQRGAPDVMRGRALTLVMSATYFLTGVGTVLAGALLHLGGARWVWIGAGISFVCAAVAGYTLARGSSEADADVQPAEPEPMPIEFTAR
jgi:dTMP kinase